DRLRLGRGALAVPGRRRRGGGGRLRAGRRVPCRHRPGEARRPVHAAQAGADTAELLQPGLGALAFEFDRDTAVEPSGDGRWTGAVAPGWSIGSAPNGGYLMAIALRAMAAAVPHPEAVSVTGYYLSPCTVGPLEVAV